MNALLTLPELPPAVFIASDVVAFGAIQAIRQHGLTIPEDIAIVGFDDVSIAQYMDPALTTIRLPANQIGKKAGELSLRLINHGSSETEGHLLPTELIIRSSCGANRQS
jgi:DNA-binding LacI/PurR family transcriptional regulator